MERNYTTQMDAARRDIVTPELETVTREMGRPASSRQFHVENRRRS